jgi:hypothetical protein
MCETEMEISGCGAGARKRKEDSMRGASAEGNLSRVGFRRMRNPQAKTWVKGQSPRAASALSIALSKKELGLWSF